MGDSTPEGDPGPRPLSSYGSAIFSTWLLKLRSSCSSVSGWQKGKKLEQGSQGPGMEAAHVSSTQILLAGRQSHDPISLQRSLGDGVLLCAQREEEPYLVNRWTVSSIPGKVK